MPSSPKSTPKTIAVLGGGNGGLASAADLALRGYEVNLYSRSTKTADEIQEIGGIIAKGPVANDKAELNLVTQNIEEAIDGVDVIEIVVPAFAHEEISRLLAPYLDEQQAIAFYGKGGGVLTLIRELELRNRSFHGIIGEACTLPYSCRKTGPAEVSIYLRTNVLPVAAFPSKLNSEFLKTILPQYPVAKLLSNVLETTLWDLNAIIHPVPVILNAGLIERSDGQFYIYKEGVTRSIANLMEAVDQERLEVIASFGLAGKRASELHSDLGFGPSGNLFHTLRYASALIRGPTDLRQRHLSEDVPFGLVSISSFAKISGVRTPLTDSIIAIASSLNSVDYQSKGRTVEKLGLANMPKETIIEYVTEGRANFS